MTRTSQTLGVVFVLATASCVAVLATPELTSRPTPTPPAQIQSDDALTGIPTDNPPSEGAAMAEPNRTPTGATTPSELNQAVGGGSPTTTDAPTQPDLYPPGVSASGLENATVLLNGFVSATTETGYVATTSGNSTIQQGGVLVGVSTDGRIAVESNATRYSEQRNTTAGPLERREEMWGNETVEFFRSTVGGSPTVEQREPRHRGVLARRPLLEPYLEGGSYVVDDVNETVEPAIVTLNGTEVANETELRKVLPGNAEEIRGFNATVRVDANGHVLGFESTVQFSIGGANRSQTVVYRLEQTDNVSVERPEWVADAEDVTDGESPTPESLGAVQTSSLRETSRGS